MEFQAMLESAEDFSQRLGTLREPDMLETG